MTCTRPAAPPCAGPEAGGRRRGGRHAGTLAAALLALAIAGCGGGGGGGGGGGDTDGGNGPPVATPPPAAADALPSDARRVGDGVTPVTPGCTGRADGSPAPAGTLYAGAEVEPMLARDPRDARRWAVAWQQDRWSDGGARAIAVAVTADAGASWRRTLLPLTRCGGAVPGSAGDHERASDPWVDIGADGVIHVGALVLDGEAFTGSSASGVAMVRSTDGGVTWEPPQQLQLDRGAAFFNDKNTHTVDALQPQRVYVVWDRLEAGNGPTRLARSLDGGLTWEPAREIYRPAAPPGGSAQTLGNRIVSPAAGAARGVLVNVFMEITQQGSTTVRRVRALRSLDGGLTWGGATPGGDAVTVATANPVGTRDPVTGTLVRDGALLPAAAAGPDGTLWVAWQDSRFGDGRVDGIALARSSDGGLSWSEPVRANADPAVAAFTPSLAVRADGLVAVSYADLGPDTADAATLRTAVRLATTRDGVRFAHAAVWPAFDLAAAPQARGLFVGDYQGLVALDQDFLVVQAMSRAAPGSATGATDLYALPVAAPLPPAAAAAPAWAAQTAPSPARGPAAALASLAR